jgi:hypothetical protein
MKRWGEMDDNKESSGGVLTRREVKEHWRPQHTGST